MITTVFRALATTGPAPLPLSTGTASAAPTAPGTAQAAPAAYVTTLAEGIEALPPGRRVAGGSKRTSFRHWTDNDKDGCSTRAEVLIAETLQKPVIEAGCRIVSGLWESYSYYDGERITDHARIDIDHMTPLAEAWDSGASPWDAERRQAYANDPDAERSLVAVTVKSNRSKADKDPA